MNQNQTIEQFADIALGEIGIHEAGHLVMAKALGLAPDAAEICVDGAGNAVDGYVTASNVNGYQRAACGWAGLISEILFGGRRHECLPELSVKGVRRWVDAVECHHSEMGLSQEDWAAISSADHASSAAFALVTLQGRKDEIWTEAKKLARQAHDRRAEIFGTKTGPEQTKGKSMDTRNAMTHEQMDQALRGPTTDGEVTDQQLASLSDLCRGMSGSQLVSLNATNVNLYKLASAQDQAPQQLEAADSADPWGLLRTESRKPKISFQLALSRPARLTVYQDGAEVTNMDCAVELLEQAA